MSKIESLKEKIELNPKEERYYYQLAELLRENRRYDQARRVLLTLLRQDPGLEEAKEAFLWLAEFCLEQGDFQQALDYWNRAVSAAEFSADDPSVHELRGRILLARYHRTQLDLPDRAILDQAIESLWYAAALDPDQQLLASIYLDLGRAYRDLDMPDMAAAHLRRALALEPEDKQRAAECHMELGLIELWDRENPEKAIPFFQLALKISPLRPPSNWLSHDHWCLSCAFSMTGNAKDAVTAGRNALQAVDPRQYDHREVLFNAHYVLGAAYSDISGQEDLAIQHYREALALKEDPEVYRYWGELHLQKGEFGQALEMFEAVLDIAPDYSRLGDIYNDIGKCLAQMKRYQEALTCFERAREEQATISFKPCEIYNNMGVSYWHLGRYDEAVEAFKIALLLMHPKDKEYRRIESYLRKVQAREPVS